MQAPTMRYDRINKDSNSSPVQRILYCEVALHFPYLSTRGQPWVSHVPAEIFPEPTTLVCTGADGGEGSGEISIHCWKKNGIDFAVLMFCVHEAGRGVRLAHLIHSIYYGSFNSLILSLNHSGITLVVTG